jgi:hypothetical protein
MQVSTLQQVEERLREVDPDILREMAFQTARSHARICGFTSQIGDCAHVESDETKDRIGQLTVAELATLLAPTTWVSIDLHNRIGT